MTEDANACESQAPREAAAGIDHIEPMQPIENESNVGRPGSQEAIDEPS
jgi:hypothetical protein